MKNQNTRVYYALQRRSDGAWLAISSYPRIKVVKEPSIVGKLSTIKSHRITAMIDEDSKHGLVDIKEIKVTAETLGTVSEDERIQSRIREIYPFLSAHFGKRNSWNANYFRMLLTDFEDLMVKKPCLDMRYLAYYDDTINSNKRKRDDSEVIDFNAMKNIANFFSHGLAVCINDDMDLIAMKLAGFSSDFIYDFRTGKVIQR